MAKNTKIIDISKPRFKQIYGYYYDNFNDKYNTDDNIGCFCMLDRAKKIYRTNPTLAGRMIDVVIHVINNEGGYNADKSGTNRIVAYCIKTNNIDLLQKNRFNPTTLSLCSLPSLFSVLRHYADKDVNRNDYFYSKLMTEYTDDVGVLFFRKFINKINNVMMNYLFKLKYLSKDYLPNLLGTLAFGELPNFYKYFDYSKPIPIDKYIGFNTLFNAYFYTKRPNSLSFDIMLRYIIIGLYTKRNGNLGRYFKVFEPTNIPPFLRGMVRHYDVPSVKMKPYYLVVFKQFKHVQHDMKLEYKKDN